MLGTDQNGRDMLARTLQGTQMSLLRSAWSPPPCRWSIGIVYGAIAGYFGGKVDAIMMRFVDIMYALPYILFVIILVVIFGRSPVLLFVGIGCLEWLDHGAHRSRADAEHQAARVHRGRARPAGQGRFAIIFRHIVPNLTGPVGDLRDADHPGDHPDRELPLLSRASASRSRRPRSVR